MPKSPNDTKKTMSNCYSITVRTGNGVNLGSNTVNSLINWIANSTLSHILTIEMDDDKAHIQGGVFFENPKRQDHLKSKLLEFAMEMYRENADTDYITEKALLNVRKHSVMVKAHNDYHVLKRYCLKDYQAIRLSKSLDIDELSIYPNRYCKTCKKLNDEDGCCFQCPWVAPYTTYNIKNIEKFREKYTVIPHNTLSLN